MRNATEQDVQDAVRTGQLCPNTMYGYRYSNGVKVLVHHAEVDPYLDVVAQQLGLIITCASDGIVTAIWLNGLFATAKPPVVQTKKIKRTPAKGTKPERLVFGPPCLSLIREGSIITLFEWRRARAKVVSIEGIYYYVKVLGRGERTYRVTASSIRSVAIPFDSAGDEVRVGNLYNHETLGRHILARVDTLEEPDTKVALINLMTGVVFGKIITVGPVISEKEFEDMSGGGFVLCRAFK